MERDSLRGPGRQIDLLVEGPAYRFTVLEKQRPVESYQPGIHLVVRRIQRTDVQVEAQRHSLPRKHGTKAGKLDYGQIVVASDVVQRSEEHTSELQSREKLVC